MGEVSLKVSRSHALSMPSPSLEFSREKIQQQAMGCFWFCRIQGQCIMTLFWAEKELMRCEIPGTALRRARAGEEIWNVGCLVTLYRHAVRTAVFFKVGLRNGSIQEKFGSWVAGEGLFFLCSLFFFPTHSFGFSSFPPENTAVIVAEMQQELCFAPTFLCAKLEKLALLGVYPRWSSYFSFSLWY